MPTAQVADDSTRTPDRVAAGLAIGFVVLLVASELVLSLPDVTASAADVAGFYAAHRSFIIVLQVLGFGAAALLAGYAWRLRRVDRVVSAAGLVMAGCSLVSGIITLVIAVVADPASPASAGWWNLLEPRGDHILFVGILLFAVVITLRLGRRLPALGVLALLVGIGCLIRLVLEMAGASGGLLDAVVPLSFLILIAVMAALSFLGVLRHPRPSPSVRSRET